LMAAKIRAYFSLLWLAQDIGLSLCKTTLK
jgi:hypothetical protein